MLSLLAALATTLIDWIKGKRPPRTLDNIEEAWMEHDNGI
jgi:hypothetical protein